MLADRASLMEVSGMKRTVLLFAPIMAVVMLVTVGDLVATQPPAQASLPGQNGKIAFVSLRDGNEEIYAMNADGTDQTRLTYNASTASTDSRAGLDVFPSFLPDGRRLAFTSRRPTGTAFNTQGGVDEIWTMDAEDRDGLPGGDNPQVITGESVDAQHNFQAAFSAGAERMVYTSTRPLTSWTNTDNEIWRINIDASNPIHLSEPVQLTRNGFVERYPTFSPDGTKIAFNRLGANDDIYVMDTDPATDDAKNLTNNAANDAFANFSPDGSKIVFSSNRRASDGTNDSEIYVMNADGSNQRPLTNNAVIDETPAFSPDGTKIAYTSAANDNPNDTTNDKEIWVMEADGSNPKPLTSNGVEDSKPDWGPFPDTTTPRADATLSAEPNANGWHREDVTVSFGAEDQGGSGVYKVHYGSAPDSAQEVPETSVLARQLPARVTIEAEGTTTLAYFAKDNAGNVEPPRTLTINLDKTEPRITVPADITTMSTGASGAAVEFNATATDNLNGDLPVSYETDSGPVVSGDTFPPGTTTVVVTAVDRAGNAAKASFNVTVRYDFQGFFRPVDNPGPGPDFVVNRARAGSAIPVKFSLGGNQGTTIPEIFAESPNSTPDQPLYYPISRQIPADPGATTDPVEETVTADSSGLSYDPLTGQYDYVWKTNKAWAGQDRELVLQLADGTEHTALFRFVK
jgi:Tol biopolymer transport system component